MKFNKLMIAAAFSAAAFMTSCEKEPTPENQLTSAVKFSSTISGQISTRAANNAWENNDAIGVYMKTGSGFSNLLGANKQYITPNNTGNFVAGAATEELFYPTDGSAVDFVAYYPYQTALSNGVYKVNLADQSQQSKIDLLYAENAKGLSKSNTNAQLVFGHELAKVEVTVSAGTGVSSLSGLTVQMNGFNNTADFDLASGVLSNPANAAAFNAKVSAGTGTSVAEAIVLPATSMTEGTVVFQLGADKFTWKLPTTTSFEAGKKYQYNIQLTTDASGQTAALVSAVITNWTDVPSGSYTIIKDEDGGSTEPTNPGTEQTLYTETFGTAVLGSTNPKIAAYTGWSNTTVTYADQYASADVRLLKSGANLTNHVWLPANKQAELSIAGISTAGASKLKLSLKVAANVFNAGTSFDVANLSIALNGQTFHPASKVLSKDNNDANIFYDVTVDLSAATNLPATSTLVISAEPTTNTVGVRVDDLSLSGLK